MLAQDIFPKILQRGFNSCIKSLKKLDIFPSSETIKKNNLPTVFRKFKNIRVIIDCFEWNMQKSKNFNKGILTQATNHTTQ